MVEPRKVVLYETPEGKCPWQECFDGLRDPKAQAAVDARLLRVQRGNLGDCKGVVGGVMELRVHVGPGVPRLFRAGGRRARRSAVRRNQGIAETGLERARAYWKDYRS